jgi:hypothetical protein
MSSHHRLDFKEFPRVWGLIHVPENYVVYRGGTKPPLLSTDPRFFSDFQTANEYTSMTNQRNGAQTYKTYACCTKELRLMDLRTMRYLLQEYVGYNRLWFDDQELRLVEKAMFALGLMSLKDQYEFIKRYAHPSNGLELWLQRYPTLQDVYYDIECESLGNAPIDQFNIDAMMSHYVQFGNRISDCSIDDEVVALLKNVFGDTVDGYIAPTFDTVWHNFRFNPELCLFDPSHSLKFTSEVPSHVVDPDAIVTPISITDILLGYSTRIAEHDLVKGGARDGVTFNGSCKIDKNKKKDTQAAIDNLPRNFAYEGSSASSKVATVWKQEKLPPRNQNTSEKRPVEYKTDFFESITKSATAAPSSSTATQGSKRPEKFGLSEEL